jgi:hypothetical protein
MLEQIEKIKDQTQKEFTMKLYQYEQEKGVDIKDLGNGFDLIVPLRLGKYLLDDETVTKEDLLTWAQQYRSAKVLLQKGATNESVIRQGLKAIEEKTGEKIDEADKDNIEKQILDLCAKSGLNLAEPLNEDYDLTKVLK